MAITNTRLDPARPPRPLCPNEYTLTVIGNPFEPEKHASYARPAGRSINVSLGIDMARHVVMRNRRVVLWCEADRLIRPGDHIVYAPEPAGGLGSKGILRMVALVAVAVVATVATGGIGGAAVLVGALQNGVSRTGSCLVLPHRLPEPGNRGESGRRNRGRNPVPQ